MQEQPLYMQLINIRRTLRYEIQGSPTWEIFILITKHYIVTGDHLSHLRYHYCIFMWRSTQKIDYDNYHCVPDSYYLLAHYWCMFQTNSCMEESSIFKLRPLYLLSTSFSSSDCMSIIYHFLKFASVHVQIIALYLLYKAVSFLPPFLWNSLRASTRLGLHGYLFLPQLEIKS